MMALALANVVAWSLQAACVIATAALAARLVRVDAAAVRHAWWRGILLLVLALPLLQPWQPSAPALQLELPAATVPAAAPAAHSAGSTSLPDRSGVAKGHVPPIFFVWVLAVGAALRLTWLAAGLVRLRRLRGTGTPAADCDEHAELRTLMQVRADVRYVDDLQQPVTFGLLRPVVLLPATLRTLPPDVRRAVLAHELWHVRRRDWVWMLAEEALRSFVWFHPAMWWLISRVQSSREEAVDELTVLLTNSRRSYLEALLAFADRPRVFPASPFAERRHLFARMLSISKEAMMSSRRIVMSTASLLAAIAVAGSLVVETFPLHAAALPPADSRVQQPPRDTRPGGPRGASGRESQLRAQLAAAPADVQGWLELAQLQERRGAASEAEATLIAMRAAVPGSVESYRALAGLHHRAGQFDRAIQVLEEAAAFAPGDPAGYQLLATFFYEKATKDVTLVPVEKMAYLRDGIAATDRALAADANFIDALIYKSLLMRTQAALEPDQAARGALLREADSIRSRAMGLRQVNPAGVPRSAMGIGPPPPPPPPPPAPGDSGRPGAPASERMPLRVGGTISAPTKVRDVRPEYPPIAIAARVQGVVILEIVIDETGNVGQARVLRSIPLLDEAAMDAVRQWQFTPTLLNGVPVPIMMTTTVNFLLPPD